MTDHDAAAPSPVHELLAAAFERDIVRKALLVALLVGTILVVINQADVVARGAMPPVWKIALTYLVPYCVSAYSAASFKVAYRRRSRSE